MHMRFDGERVEAAFRAVFSGLLDDPVSQELTDPDGLGTSIAVELASSIASAEAISDGATAALCGILVGVRLADAGERIPDALPAAVETVRVLGRSRVIAAHCDLGAVARVEHEVVSGFGFLARGRRDSLLRLFELGFAIGLAARYA